MEEYDVIDTKLYLYLISHKLKSKNFKNNVLWRGVTTTERQLPSPHSMLPLESGFMINTALLFLMFKALSFQMLGILVKCSYQ